MTNEQQLIQEFVCQRYRVPEPVELQIVPLRGGLVCDGIARVIVQAAPDPVSFVVKPLCGPGIREARVHRCVEKIISGGLAPQVLGWKRIDSSSGLLFLEWVEGFDPWPWQFDGCAAMLLRELARLHTEGASHVPNLTGDWDYEAELEHSARETTEFYDSVWRSGTRPAHRAMVRSLTRLTEALPRIRRQLQQQTGRTLLHGDVHPGNAIVSRRKGKSRAVLLDWGRARGGSALEDVSSFLQSLAFWEPRVRQSHDTLFRSWIEATGSGQKLDENMRQSYWLAAACNALAGALRYHLAVMSDPAREETERDQSRWAAADWLRIIRRADVVWRAC